MSLCSHPDCEKPAQARGLCNTHYMRLRRAGEIPIGTRARGTPQERFWRYVDKTDSCWNWIGGGRNDKGYGHIGAGGKGGKTILAHRLSYEIHNGPIPDEMVVMHKCDNPACVNPDHLMLGTMSENTQDAVKKGRWKGRPPLNFGENQRSAVLTEEMVRLIRSDTGMTLIALAKMFGVSKSAVLRARHRQTWKHIP